MTNSDIKVYAKSCIKGNIAKIFLPFLLVFLIETLLSLPSIVDLVNSFDPYKTTLYETISGGMAVEISSPFINNKLLSLVSDVVGIIIGVLYVGLADICISVVRKSPYSLSDVFSAMSQFIGVILTNLLAGLFIFLKLLLLIVPGIIESYALAMTNFVRADDPSLGAHEAIERSRWLMDGNKLDFFKLQLSFIPWFLLSIVTLGIGFVYVIPYYNVSVAAFYESLLMQERAMVRPDDTANDPSTEN